MQTYSPISFKSMSLKELIGCIWYKNFSLEMREYAGKRENAVALETIMKIKELHYFLI